MIKVNEEKEKIKIDYEEVVKVLEVVEKVVNILLYSYVIKYEYIVL